MCFWFSPPGNTPSVDMCLLMAPRGRLPCPLEDKYGWGVSQGDYLALEYPLWRHVPLLWYLPGRLPCLEYPLLCLCGGISQGDYLAWNTPYEDIYGWGVSQGDTLPLELPLQ